MIRKACLSLLPLCLPLSATAQSPFRITRHAGLPLVYFGDKFAAGDLDGDGDLDLFVANDNSPNQLLLNDGDGRFTDETIARVGTLLPEASHSVDLADIDNDGDLDVLIGNDDNLTNRVYRNNGLGFFTDVTATALPPNQHFTTNQVVADFDGDGDVDWLTFDGGPCRFYENDGTGVFTDTSAARLSGLPNLIGNRYDVTPFAADIDGDNDLDVMLPLYAGSAYLIVNQGGVLVPGPTQLPPTPGGRSHWFADYDGDGDPDVLLDRGRVLLQNQGNGTFVDVTATAFPVTTMANNFACFDCDNDGDLDLIGATRVWLNNGNGTFAALTATTTLNWGYNLGVASADFDGDGDIDLPGKPNFLRQTFAPSVPLRGGNYSVELHARPNTTSLVGACGSLGTGTLPVGPFGVLRLDPNSAAPLAVAQVATGPLTLTWAIPNLPGLVGLELDYQALVVDPLDGPLVSNRIRDLVQ